MPDARLAALLGLYDIVELPAGRNIRRLGPVCIDGPLYRKNLLVHTAIGFGSMAS